MLNEKSTSLNYPLVPHIPLAIKRGINNLTLSNYFEISTTLQLFGCMKRDLIGSQKSRGLLGKQMWFFRWVLCGTPYSMDGRGMSNSVRI